MHNVKQYVMTAFDNEQLANDLEQKFLMAHLAKTQPKR
jgi:hypothetical protein